MSNKRPSGSSSLENSGRRVKHRSTPSSGVTITVTAATPPTSRYTPPSNRQPKAAPVPPQPLTNDEWLVLSRKSRKQLREQSWLQLSQSWKGFAGVWKGVRVLGSGGYGIAGLFEYTGTKAGRPKNIVVKQSGQENRAELLEEGRTLQQLGKSGSIHIVKLLKAFYEEGGTGTGRRNDPSPFRLRKDGSPEYQRHLELCRLYLEYCEGGDMWQCAKAKFK